jgi:hypothetical protein
MVQVLRNWFRKECLAGGGVGLIFGFAFVLWSQTAMAQNAPPLNDPSMEILTRLLSTGGMPAATGVFGWYIAHTIHNVNESVKMMTDNIAEKFSEALHSWEPVITVKYPDESDSNAALKKRIEELEAKIRKDAGR